MNNLDLQLCACSGSKANLMILSNQNGSSFTSIRRMMSFSSEMIHGSEYFPSSSYKIRTRDISIIKNRRTHILYLIQHYYIYIYTLVSPKTFSLTSIFILCFSEFVNCVRCIRILSPSEVQQMSQEGLQFMNSYLP